MWYDINTKLFLLINASDQASKSFIYFAIFCANYLMFFPIIMLASYWFLKPDYRQSIVKIIVSLVLALLISFVIRHLFYSPRPFALDVGTHYLYHETNSSLPSQHAVFVWTLFFSIFFNAKQQVKKLYYCCFVVALLVCWSRIYLGIHWPLDIIISFIISLLSAYFVSKSWVAFFK